MASGGQSVPNEFRQQNVLAVLIAKHDAQLKAWNILLY